MRMDELDLLATALSLANLEERAAFLERECAGHPELKARLEGLIHAHFQSATVGTPPEDLAAPSMAPLSGTGEFAGADGLTGVVIAGRYTLLEVIGEGGMGAVWRARQLAPVKRFVAVKLIKPGLNSKQVLARFDAERQALALMDHPHIAKVLDGGVYEHRPFFVMELVNGVPITEYCDSHKLTLAERLELFLSVCHAIQHAHQKGIVHRDIKPNNVLIARYDDKPVVKVIDFGVAKATGGALTDQTLDTGFGAVIGTPQYMSPEQATLNNQDIDTRSDVYALGVLLYELLTGSPPFSSRELEQKGLLEMLRVVREEEPPRPSTKLNTAESLPTLSANRRTEPKKLTGVLRHELDWIVMKALEKDRGRRYDTASGFAADVRRYLSGEAVEAHPPSTVYRLKKLVQKHTGRVVAASMVLLTLLAGIAGTTWGTIEAHRQRRVADARRADAERAQQAERERADGEQVAKLEALRQQAAAERQVRETKAAESILLLGLRSSLQDWPIRESDVTPERPVSVERLLAGIVDSLNQQLPVVFDDEPHVQARARALIAWLLSGFELLESARQQYVAALAQYRRQSPDLINEDIVNVLDGLSEILMRQAEYEEAEPFLREIVDWSRNRDGAQDVMTRDATNRLADALHRLGKLTEAAQFARQALEAGPSTPGHDDETTLESQEILGRTYSELGKWSEAEELLERAVEARRRLNTPEYPPRLQATEALATHLLRCQRPAQAEPLLRESWEAREASEPYSWATFHVQSLLGAALLGQQKYADAEPLLLQGFEGLQLRQPSIPAPDLASIPAALDRLIALYTATNRPAEAQRWQAERAKYPAGNAESPRTRRAVLRE